MKNIFKPKNILVLFICLFLIHILDSIVFYNNSRCLWNYIWIFYIFCPSQIMIMVISIINCISYRKDKRQLVLSIIPLAILSFTMIFMILVLTYRMVYEPV